VALRESNAPVAVRLERPHPGTYARALSWLSTGRGGEWPRQGLGSNNKNDHNKKT